MAIGNPDFWLELVIRRKSIFLQVAGFVLGLVAIGSYLWPPVYEATAKILVQDNRAQFLVSPDLQDSSPDKPAVVANPVSEEDLNSERELIASLYLVKNAIADLPATPSYTGPGSTALKLIGAALALPQNGYDALHQGPTMSPQDEWALKLERHLETSLIKRSNIFEVDFRSHDARWSQEFLSRLLSQYLAFHARISHDPQAEKFFAEQASILQTRLNASEEALRTFQDRTGITDLAEQTRALVDRLSSLQLEYDRDGAQLASVQGQSAFLGALLQNTPERIGKETRAVQNLALQQLKPQVMGMKAERAELLSRYQPTSQKIQEVDAKLAAAQKVLDQEDHLEVQERSTDLNPIWVTIKSDLAQAKTQAAASSAARQSLEAEIAKARSQLSEMTDNGLQIQRLERQVTADKEAYMAYARKSEEARAAQALNANKILNVSVAQEPMMPLQPEFPIIWLNFLVGGLLAAALGLGAAYWEETTDPKIYSTYAITQASGLSTIAVLNNQA